MNLIIFVLLLVALIVVHELGHFAAAKLGGIRVDEFGIGFPPRIAAVRFGETEYSLNWLFLGGFVRIWGESKGEGKGNRRSFSGRSRGLQGAIVAAGICMNLLFAWALLSGGYMAGLPSAVTPENAAQIRDAHVSIVDTLPNSPAAAAGIMPGDTLERMSAGGTALTKDLTADRVRSFVQSHQSSTLSVTVLRDGSEKTFSVKPQAGIVAGSKIIGIEFADVGTLRLPFFSALREGGVVAFSMIHDTAYGLIGFFGSVLAAHADFSQVAGPVGIVSIGASAVAQGWSSALLLTALISINLALLNVLPIPGLDGGRLAMIAIEAVRRRALPERAVAHLTMAGFALLVLLVLVATYHDIARLL